jgi:hypothetical protein
MKTYSLILLPLCFFILFSCNGHEPCECYTPPYPLRFTILDSLDNNRLDSNKTNFLKIDKIRFPSGEELTFNITSYYSEPPHFYIIESRSDSYYNKCIGNDCKFYISYFNSIDVDTFTVFIEKQSVRKNDDCVCTFYKNKNVTHNGIEIKEFDTKHFPGETAIIRKN